MSRSRLIRILPLGMLCLVGCAANPPPQPTASADGTGTSKTGDNVQMNSPAYQALKAGDYASATAQFQASNAATAHSPYDELDLGTAYQNQGRMDLAEPWYRRAITDGHGLVAAHTTDAKAAGHTVEEIACQNLRVAQPGNTAPDWSTTCPSTLVLDVATASASTADSNGQIASFNTYFAFDKSDLNADGRANVDAAAKQVLADPARRVSLVGKASNVGSDAYNMNLSRQRAETIRTAMMADGVPASRIDTQWLGATALAVPEAPGVHEPLNRVVESVVQ